LLTERGAEETAEQLLGLKLPALIRKALACGVDGDLLGDALRGVQTTAPEAEEPEPEPEADVLVTCENCQAPVMQSLLEDHHEVCRERPVPCINAAWGCDATMPRWQRGSHLQHCPASVVVCGGVCGSASGSELPPSWRPGADDPNRSPAEARCRWLGMGQSICGAVVRRDQWEQHVQLHHCLLPLERTEYKVDAATRPGDPAWYHVEWPLLWEWLLTLGWRELKTMTWWGAKDRLFLKPGVPYDPTGERLYTYLPTDYARDEFDLRRNLATTVGESELAWLRSHGTVSGAPVVREQQQSEARAAGRSEREVVSGANRCHFCCAVSTPRIELATARTPALRSARQQHRDNGEQRDEMQVAGASWSRHSLRVMGSGVLALEPAAVPKNVPPPILVSDATVTAAAAAGAKAGTAATGTATATSAAAAVAAAGRAEARDDVIGGLGGRGRGLGMPARMTFAELSLDIHQQVARHLAPGDLTRLGQARARSIL
jgi:hypothetical protein